MTKEQFIEKAIKIHGNKYDYSKVEYKNNKTKVCIVCPIHGEFYVKPNNHLNGNECPVCGAEKRKNTLRNKLGITKNEFVKRTIKIHGNKYDYSKVEYKNIDTKVCIVCPIHGEFWQSPYMHLKGQGCPKCGFESNRLKQKNTTNEFIERATEIHCDKYDYSKVEYNNNKTKVCIVCPIHGEFWQLPSDHIRGHGCPYCNESKLEKDIRLLLSDKNIKFKHHASNEDFGWIGRKHLDFYLPDYNIAIECQGEQHFKSVKHFGGNKKYEKRKLNDQTKKELCEKNGITLLYYTNFLCEESKNMCFSTNEILDKINGYNMEKS